MNDGLKKFANQTRTFYSSMTPARRLSFLGILVCVLIVFGVAMYLIATEEYETLASGLAPEDSQAIASLLRDQNIPTHISSDGDKISVPSSHIDQARLEMASSGLPQGGSVGYEIFDKTDIGMTAFREQVNFRRALEGELSRTIRNLEEVHSARVHIVLPKKTIFKEDQKQPSASVVVNLNPGHELAKKQIKGIRYLVSSAIEGMTPERVTLLDGRGAVLARMGEEGEVGSGNGRLEYQHVLERSFERRILDLLEPLVGIGRVVAKVTAEVDYRTVVETSEQYNPARVVVRSEQRSEEKRQGAGARAAGVAGARSNIPGGARAQSKTSGESFEHNTETINYEVDKKVLQTEHAKGGIQRLSVAVVVDGVYEKTADDKKVYKERSQEEISRLASLVKKAIGFDANRGDQVEVSNVAFEPPEIPEPSVFGWYTTYKVGPIIRVVGLLFLALVLLLFVLRPIVKNAFPEKSKEILEPGQTTTVAELERKLLENEPQKEENKAIEPPEDDLATVARRIAADNPTRVVQVLRNWLEGSKV